MAVIRIKSLSTDVMLLCRETLKEWSEDGASGIAASLAYYTIFSLSPLLILIALLLGLVLDQSSIQTGMIDGVRTAVGEGGAEFMLNLMHSRQTSGSDFVGTVIWLSVVIWGASGLFAQLQSALNKIWEVRPVPGRSPTAIVRLRFKAFLLVMFVALVMLLSMLANTALNSVLAGGQHQTAELIARPLQLILTVVITALLIGAVFKTLPDVIIDWEDLWVGATVTAVLFCVGQLIVGFYLAHANVGSVFGAAGSLTAILVWIYYSAQILLLGAEFTEVWARHFGKYIRPDDDAMWINEANAREEADEAHVTFDEDDSNKAKLSAMAEDRKRRSMQMRRMTQHIRVRRKPGEASEENGE